MVLDINVIRQNPDEIREQLKKRFRDTSILDKVLELDEDWRKERFNNDEINKIKNLCSKAIKNKKKAREADGDNDTLPDSILNNLKSLNNDSISELSIVQIKRLSKELDDEIAQCSVKRQAIENSRNKVVSEIPNILHKDVVISKDEDENAIIRMNGDTTTKKTLSHVDLVEMINGVDFKMGQQNSGSRCYYLKGPLVELEQALIIFCLEIMKDEEFEYLSPPLFMNKEAMQQVAQLSQFDEELYKVVCRRTEESTDTSEEEKYLIATSEQAIAAFNRDCWIPKSELPLRYLGISECFRQEVGSHGRDTRGIFRVHQFKKVEQFCVTSPHDGESEIMFHKMIGNAENLYKKLEIPYRVVSIVSGELNNAASIKYDLEGWFPGSGAFRELVSCSNCTDYQSRSILSRFGETKQMNQDAEYVHMLNSTLAATTRVLCAILENYQTETGINVPKVLQKYMFKYGSFIPFSKKVNTA